MNAAAVIVAAGKGTRMGPNVDKLFLELNEEPVIVHTWRAMDSAQSICEVVLVVRDGMQSAFSELAAKAGFRKPYRLVVGGKERQDSVWNGLEALGKDCDVVAIQDGARPCTSPELVDQTIRVATLQGAAVAAQPVTDTIKESRDGMIISKNLERKLLWAVQTPQTFRVEVIRKALQRVRDLGLNITDDTAACELIGQVVHLVPSNEPNPKVTHPHDLPYIGQLLRERALAKPGHAL